MSSYDVIVLGGGPAGLMAAAGAAARGKSVIILEKNDILARKLRITGKGRCNITNTAEVEDLIKNVVTNGRFLYSSFYTFTNDDTVNFLNSLGVKTKIERGGRVFPESDSANEVADALAAHAKNSGAKASTAIAKSLVINAGAVGGVVTKASETISANSVLIATGGASYPGTGSTGDGYRLAKAVGHTIIPPRPSLVPLTTAEDWVSGLMGLSLKNIEIKLRCKGKVLYSEFGEMLFTHFGVSGPVILSASAYMKNYNKSYELFIDLKPALTIQQLDARILRDFEKYINKNFSNALDELLPQKLIPVIVRLSGISPDVKVNSITKEQRALLVSLLKGLPLTVTGTRPINEAIITSGGIKVSEINPSTMESKLVNGLYFAGEVIDCDAYTGGFNLQIAFSTGYLAGENI